MFASGDRITITGNIIEGNGIHGIDIKSSLASYPAASWGEGKLISIVSNMIRNNTINGIRINKTTADEWPRGIEILGNQILSNGEFGIQAKGHHIGISHNTIAFNAQTGTSNEGGIFISGIVGDVADDVLIHGNQIFNNGSNTESYNPGIEISSQVNAITITDNIVTNDSVLTNDEQNRGISFASTNVTNIVMRNNQANGHSDKDVSIPSGGGFNISGETISAYIGTIAAGTTDERAIFSPDRKTIINSAYIINASDITQNDTDYDTLSIVDRGSDGSTTNTITTVNTKTTGGVAILDFDAMSLGTVSTTHMILAAHDVVTFKKTHTSNGQGLDEARVIINYITY